MPTYTAPTTRTTGELISAAIFNTDLVENIKYFKDAPAFAGNVTVGGTLGVTGATTLSSGTYSTFLKSTTALATPSALTATQATEFASTVSGAAIMGFGTTNDVSLMNRAGTVVLGVGPNTTTVNMTGLLSVTGFGTHNFSAGGTGSNILAVRNTTAGTSMASEIYLGNDVSNLGAVLAFTSSTYTAAGAMRQAGFALRSFYAGGVSIAAENASGAIRFYSGGTTLAGTILSTGQQVMGSSGTVRNSAWLTIDYSGSTYNGLSLNDNSSSNGGTFQVFAIGAGTVCGSITRNGATSAVVYNLTSDKRLKHDLGLATDLSGLQGLAIHDFTWITDESGYRDRGVFAQDAYRVMQRGITPGKIEQDYWQVSYTSYVPDLIVGWQQHDARLAAMEAKLLAAGV